VKKFLFAGRAPAVFLGLSLLSQSHGGQSQETSVPSATSDSDRNASQVSGANCSFIARREEFQNSQLRARQDVVKRVSALDAFLKQPVSNATASDATITATVDAGKLPHRNFVDDIILGGLVTAQVPAAPVSSDYEFIRRITLDLTGRIPSSADIKAFVANTAPDKRDVLIEQLLYSAEFVDKWTMWLGDLLQNVSNSTYASPGLPGRDTFYNYLRSAVADDKSFRDIAYDAITATGDTADYNAGTTNFIYRSQTPGGPVQDSYDTVMARTGNMFLGITYYDCLLCHSGRGHLDSISLWGSTVTRQDAQSMAAFFSRLNFNMPRTSNNVNDPMFNSWRVIDNTSAGYNLNTSYGNRPNRLPYGTIKTLTPVYLGTGATAATGQNWRDAFAKQMMVDPMFSRNFANRMFKAFFNLGLVDPVDNMDPARLDPNKPPPAPWTLQAANPQLLDKLATEAVYRNFQFKDFIRVLVQSTSYQLSSRYDSTWTISSVPLYARHYPRRLDAEEVHDAIAKATGVMGNYAVNGPSAPLIQWAMQLPDPLAPAGSGANLLNIFLRGNRDTILRSSDASIQQRLVVMNDGFVTNRTKVAASPELMTVSKMTDNNAIIDELFLTFVSRLPTDDERAKALAYLTTGTTTAALRNNAIEDLAWALINKIDFLYSY
jgi:Protein of unknown function (DUF1549)/Protein of unknown function (DUF1553)